MNTLAIALHGVAAAIWIGGMFFAYMVLRPTLVNIKAPQRLSVWAGVFKRFFPWVWMAVFILLSTGYWLIFKAFGGFATSPLYVHVMHFIGLVMMVLFVYLFYRPYALFKRMVAIEQWPAAGSALNRVRHVVLVNLILGLLLLVLVYGGRYGLY